MQKKIVVALILAIAIAFFAIINSAPIPIHLIVATVHVSTALVILISAAAGAVLVYFIGAISRLKGRKAYRELEARNLSCENELKRLRSALQSKAEPQTEKTEHQKTS